MSILKKMLALVIVIIILPTIFTCVHATEYSRPESYEGILTVIPDETTPPQVSYGGYTPAIPLNSKTRSTDGPVYYFQSLIGTLSASAYSESWNRGKTLRYPIDLIVTEISVYEYNNHVADRNDAQTNSYTARASYTGDGLSSIVNREVYGYHLFQLQGYELIEKETYAGYTN